MYRENWKRSREGEWEREKRRERERERERERRERERGGGGGENEMKRYFQTEGLKSFCTPIYFWLYPFETLTSLHFRATTPPTSTQIIVNLQWLKVTFPQGHQAVHIVERDSRAKLWQWCALCHICLPKTFRPLELFQVDVTDSKLKTRGKTPCRWNDSASPTPPCAMRMGSGKVFKDEWWLKDFPPFSHTCLWLHLKRMILCVKKKKKKEKDCCFIVLE